MQDQSQSESFYAALPAFDRFDEFVDFSAYTPVPQDWVVMITDVQGSTNAIAEGRYKDVNMVGAATITAVLNACGELEVPYVFGGDGGTLVVPGRVRDAAAKALQDLQAASDTMFGLALRVGAVPVSDLRQAGTDVAVRKYALSPGNHLAMFAGGGLERADELLKSKSPDNPYVLHTHDVAGTPDLTGLSCRWEPLRPKDGCMLTLMVQGRGASREAESLLLGETLFALSQIIGHDLRDSAPASDASMRFKWPPRHAMKEIRALAPVKGMLRAFLWVIGTSLVQTWCERFDKKAGDYDGAVYREELKSNTDFRKYDGVLRTVIDVTPQQADAIEAYLEEAYASGRLIYGTHRADSALMTCLVFNMAQSEHVHFIDGADGGFAMAATGFKKRMTAGEAS